MAIHRLCDKPKVAPSETHSNGLNSSLSPAPVQVPASAGTLANLTKTARATANRLRKLVGRASRDGDVGVNNTQPSRGLRSIGKGIQKTKDVTTTLVGSNDDADFDYPSLKAREKAREKEKARAAGKLRVHAGLVGCKLDKPPAFGGITKKGS